MDKKGLTLLEIIVSVLILALVMTGIANIFLAGKRHLGHTRSKIQAAELGRLFVAPLQKDVRQDKWGSNCLSAGSGCPGAQTIGSITYTPTYAISDVNVGVGSTLPLRKVKVTIKWNEPQAQ